MPSTDLNPAQLLAESSSHVSQSTNTRKRAASDAESREPKKLRPDPTIDSPSLPSSSKDKKKRKKKKRKASIVSPQQNQEQRQRSASTVPLPRHTSEEDSRMLPAMDGSTDVAVEQLDGSNTIDGPLAGTSDNSNSPRQDKGKAKALSPPPTVDEGFLEARIASLTLQLESQSNVLEKHQSIFQSFQQSLTCQICLDFLHKPYALAPCGHIACYNCLLTWFTNVPTSGPQPRSHMFRRKTCPVCRAIVTERPAEVWTIKSMVGTLVRSGLAALPTDDSPVLPASTSATTENNNNAAATDVNSASIVGTENARQPSASRNTLGNNDPWDGVFRALHRTRYYPALPPLPAGAANGPPGAREEPANLGGVENMGMLDEEDGVYRCIDCLHEIWDGSCSNCERVYPGHTLGMPLMGVDDLDDEDDDLYSHLRGWPDALADALRRHLERQSDEDDDEDDDDDPDPEEITWTADAQVVDEDALDEEDEDTDMDSFIVHTDEEDESGFIVDDDDDDDDEVGSISSRRRRLRAAQRSRRRTSSAEETAAEELNEDLIAAIRSRQIARFGGGERSAPDVEGSARTAPTTTAHGTRNGARGNGLSQSQRRSRTNRTVPTIVLGSDDEAVDLDDLPGPSNLGGSTNQSRASNRGLGMLRVRRYPLQESDDEDSDEGSDHGVFSSYDEDAGPEPYPWAEEDRANELEVLGPEGYEDLQRRRQLFREALEQRLVEVDSRRIAGALFETVDDLEIARRFGLTRDQQHPELRRREDERRDRLRNMVRIVQGPTLAEWAAQREGDASASTTGPSSFARRVVSLDTEEEESEDDTPQPTRRTAQSRRVVVLDEDGTEPEENNRGYDIEYAVFGTTSESDDDDDQYRTASPPSNRNTRGRSTRASRRS